MILSLRHVGRKGVRDGNDVQGAANAYEVIECPVSRVRRVLESPIGFSGAPSLHLQSSLAPILVPNSSRFCPVGSKHKVHFLHLCKYSTKLSVLLDNRFQGHT